MAPVTEVPRRLRPRPSTTDRIFRGGSFSIGFLVLAITGSIGVFLGFQSIPTLRHYGLHFFVENQWQPEQDIIGISAVLLGTVCVAAVALAVAFPIAFTTALYISEYAPPRLRGFLVSMVDLMAAVPSIIWGLFGRDLLEDHFLVYVSHWIQQHAGWIPIFEVETDPNAAVFQQSRYVGSAFIAGIAVSFMVIPMACAVMRQVFSQAPLAEREAALALGATRWGMIRTVVLPFGRGGIIGGTMLSLGRALGETIAVVLIISPAFDLKIRILEIGTITVSSLIAGRFAEASAGQLSALLTAGFVLFLITLLVNTIAATIVNRSRSGAATDI
ncbi:MAG TPA: phosphate ABC transporter permease subunit PstC [Micromonosporaceae bacterium]|nr:phosphate ABC transporter permease subunit PstC [Micromonosporaceae bacterium]